MHVVKHQEDRMWLQANKESDYLMGFGTWHKLCLPLSLSGVSIQFFCCHPGFFVAIEEGPQGEA